MTQSLAEAIAELDENASLHKVKEAMTQGRDPVSIVEECRQGIQVVGSRFDKGEYFLSELILGAEIFKEAMQILDPALAASKGHSRLVGKVVIGTVKGDIHDLGKNVVIAMLSASGFQVSDLGVDVPPEKFVEEVRKLRPDVVGLSALLTLSFDAMKETVQALQAAGLRKEIGIMVGGGPVNETVREYVGADAWGQNAAQAVDVAKRLVGAG